MSGFPTEAAKKVIFFCSPATKRVRAWPPKKKDFLRLLLASPIFRRRGEGILEVTTTPLQER